MCKPYKIFSLKHLTNYLTFFTVYLLLVSFFIVIYHMCKVKKIKPFKYARRKFKSLSNIYTNIKNKISVLEKRIPLAKKAGGSPVKIHIDVNGSKITLNIQTNSKMGGASRD